MKKSIEWHEDCLKNRRIHLQESIRRVEIDKAAFNLYEAQVNLAKKEKKDGFDSDKYLVKRLKSQVTKG